MKHIKLYLVSTGTRENFRLVAQFEKPIYPCPWYEGGKQDLIDHARATIAMEETPEDPSKETLEARAILYRLDPEFQRATDQLNYDRYILSISKDQFGNPRRVYHGD